MNSFIHPGAIIGKNVSIGKFCEIREGCMIGDNTTFGSRCTLAARSLVGRDCIIKYGFVMTDTPDLKEPTRKVVSIIGHRVLIGANVTIMPGVTVGNDVTIGAGSIVFKDIPDGETWFGSPAKKHWTDNNVHRTAIIHPNVKLGKGNTIGAYCVIGAEGFIRGNPKYNGTVTIGDNNKFGSHCTVMVGPEGETEIGSDNLIMNYSNIGHNAYIGSYCEIGVNAVLGGHCCIEDSVQLKMSVTVRNRKTIGQGSLVGMGSVVVKDIGRNEVVYGVPARVKELI